MDSFSITCGLIAAVAILFAWASRDRDALSASVILWGVWLNYALAWTPYSPVKTWQAWGFDVHSLDLWSLIDCLNCFAMFLIWRSTRKWWAGILSILVGIGCYLYVLKHFSAIDKTQFYYLLDLLFLAEEAVFYAFGGGEIVRLVICWLDRRNFNLSVCRARAKAFLAGGVGG